MAQKKGLDRLDQQTKCTGPVCLAPHRLWTCARGVPISRSDPVFTVSQHPYRRSISHTCTAAGKTATVNLLSLKSYLIRSDAIFSRSRSDGRTVEQQFHHCARRRWIERLTCALASSASCCITVFHPMNPVHRVRSWRMSIGA